MAQVHIRILIQLIQVESICLLMKKSSFSFPTDVGCDVSRFSYCRCLDRSWMIECLNVRMKEMNDVVADQLEKSITKGNG